MIFGNGVENLARRIAAGDSLGIGGKRWQLSVPSIRQFALLQAVELVGQIGILQAVLLEQRIPFSAQLSAALAHDFAEILADAIGNKELGVFWPAIETLREFDFVFTERFAVRLLGVLPVRCPVSNVAVDNNELWTIANAERMTIGICQHIQIVRVVDVRDVPTIGFETSAHVLVEGQVRLALNGDLVVVVNPAQIRKPQMSGDGRGLGRNALHHVAVAAKDPHVVAEEFKSRTIKMSRQPTFGDGHADTVRNSLTERARSGLDACGQAVFRMAGSLAAQLSEVLDVIE